MFEKWRQFRRNEDGSYYVDNPFVLRDFYGNVVYEDSLVSRFPILENQSPTYFLVDGRPMHGQEEIVTETKSSFVSLVCNGDMNTYETLLAKQVIKESGEYVAYYSSTLRRALEADSIRQLINVIQEKTPEEVKAEKYNEKIKVLEDAYKLPFKLKNGYRRIRHPITNKRIYLQRYVCEIVLDRPLKDTEQIVFIDGNRENCNANNIRIVDYHTSKSGKRSKTINTLLGLYSKLMGPRE